MAKIKIPSTPVSTSLPFMDTDGDDIFVGSSGIDQVFYMTPNALKIDLASTLPQNTGSGLDTFSSVEMIFAGSGNDQIAGDASDNVFFGQGGSDVLSGAAGDDALFGGAGADKLDGGAGIDMLIGGEGKDTLTGGKGKDFFSFSELPAKGANADVITDFNVKDDQFVIPKTIFKKLTGKLGSELKESNFYKSAGATKGHDKDDRIVFDTKSGKLYYDADGNGGGKAELIATLKMNKTLASLSHKDFYI